VAGALGSGTVSTDRPAVPPPGTASRVAAGIVGVQALALSVFAVFYLVEFVRGGSDDAARVLSSVVLIAAFAAGLAFLARGLRSGHPAVRSPTVVWELLLLPVGVGLVQSGQALIGVLVLAASVGCLLAVALSRRPEA
jgi:hypothetical protein